jgi:hypothetical protein
VLAFAFTGPWATSPDGAGTPEWCVAPHILVGERCVRLILGTEIINILGQALASIPYVLLSGSYTFAEMVREVVFMLLLALLVLPFITTPLVLLLRKVRCVKVLNRVVWQLAIVPLVWFIPFGVMNSRGRLMWGFWLYAAVVLVMIFMQIRRRPRAASIAPLIGGVLVVTFLSGCAPRGAKNWPFSIGPQTYAVALGDLDGDGDLDAYLANGENEVPMPDTVWLNDGSGNFTDSGQQISNRESRQVILADLDQDGDLDALVADTGSIWIYRNDGQGRFGAAQNQLYQPDSGAYVLAPAVGDVNGNGWLDVLVGGCCGAVEVWDSGRRQVHSSSDALWISDGQGHYTDSGQTFDVFGTRAVALGDLDGDGDLDAFFANAGSLISPSETMQQNQPDTVWFNDGLGNFTQSPQALSTGMAQALALGDLDGDGDLDALVGNRHNAEVWLNAGGAQGGVPGEFVQARWQGRLDLIRALFLADLDGDGDLDVLAVGGDVAVVWLNDGQANFSTGVRMRFEPQHALAVGDLNQDGYPDIFAGSVNHGILIWLNDGQAGFTRK